MIFRGLLEKLESEAQLAALISHEMGHAVNEHLSEDLERNLGLSLLNLLFNHFTDNQYQTITNIAQNLIANGYSREQERESDIYGFDLMLRSDYNPQALVELMQIFAKNSKNNKLLEFTQTHPIPESRIEYLEKRIGKQQNKKEKALQIAKEKDETERIEIKTNKKQTKNFTNQIISFAYPQSWQLKKEKNLTAEMEFKYSLQTEEARGEIFLLDLTKKEFMQTAAKQFNFESLRAVEKGFEIKKEKLSQAKLNIYRLQIAKGDKVGLKYFISPKDKQLMLNFDFRVKIKELNQFDKKIKTLIDSLDYK